MDDTELRTALGQIFRSLAELRQAQFETQKMAEATFQTLRLVPGFSQPLYAQKWEEISRQSDGLHESAMQRLLNFAQLFDRGD